MEEAPGTEGVVADAKEMQLRLSQENASGDVEGWMMATVASMADEEMPLASSI